VEIPDDAVGTVEKVIVVQEKSGSKYYGFYISDNVLEFLDVEKGDLLHGKALTRSGQETSFHRKIGASGRIQFLKGTSDELGVEKEDLLQLYLWKD